MAAPVQTTDLSAGTWAIDPVHSSISFSVRHLVVSKVRGTFGTFSGAVTVAEDGTPSVSAEIEVASVNSGNEQRDAHLKAADFFDVEKYPTASFVSTSVTPDGEDYRLEGDFTLNGVTRPVQVAQRVTAPGHRHQQRLARTTHLRTPACRPVEVGRHQLHTPGLPSAADERGEPREIVFTPRFRIQRAEDAKAREQRVAAAIAANTFPDIGVPARSGLVGQVRVAAQSAGHINNISLAGFEYLFHLIRV